jgi:hypothetical protein
MFWRRLALRRAQDEVKKTLKISQNRHIVKK